MKAAVENHRRIVSQASILITECSIGKDTVELATTTDLDCTSSSEISPQLAGHFNASGFTNPFAPAGPCCEAKFNPEADGETSITYGSGAGSIGIQTSTGAAILSSQVPYEP